MKQTTKMLTDVMIKKILATALSVKTMDQRETLISWIENHELGNEEEKDLLLRVVKILTEPLAFQESEFFEETKVSNHQSEVKTE